MGTHLRVLSKNYPMNTNMTGLTLPMLIIILGYFHPKHKNAKNLRKLSKPCHVGIHWIALAEFYQMSTHVPGFQSFTVLFCITLYWPN